MATVKKLPDLILNQLSKDGMSMLLGGAGTVETINNSTSGKCNAINHSTHCDVVNNDKHCTVINNRGNCSDINNWLSCREINKLS